LARAYLPRATYRRSFLINCSTANWASASDAKSLGVADRFVAQPGPTGMSAFAPLLGHKRTSDRLSLLGIPVHPASLIRLAGATFMILGVVLIQT
jgi:hypothetical protein